MNKTIILDGVLHTVVGKNAYHHEPKLLNRIKKCSKIAKLSWQVIAGYSTDKAIEFCNRVESMVNPVN